MSTPTAFLYYPPGVTVQVIEGEPPTDQSGEVISLRDQVATLTTQRDALATERDDAVAALNVMITERDALRMKLGQSFARAEEALVIVQQLRDGLS